MEVAMRNSLSVRTVVLVFTCLFLIAAIPASVSAGSATINCQAHDGPCSLPLGTATVTLDVNPKPVTALQDSTFTVTLSGKPPAQAPYLDLGMPTMKMGPNRVMLKSNGQGAYTGKGVIVRCKSGRRTWFANVVIPGAGEAKFIFDVVY